MNGGLHVQGHEVHPPRLFLTMQGKCGFPVLLEVTLLRIFNLLYYLLSNV